MFLREFNFFEIAFDRILQIFFHCEDQMTKGLWKRNGRREFNQ